ncbi:P-loop containing nucleoside triphosphate hydrolase protein [Xylariaceae sp. FL1272]|nr:P-loop containing nucleoside triphosphate hydrolase protein [Xylariaceae sp. FL1272]
MVNSNLKKSGHFEDIIKGKGGGVVILLHGPPGVGKTLTAESVAESVKKPLYMVTAGDLGTEPEQLELKLSEIFQSAARWDAILLLDEADIFLQDRDYDNLTRNALVSIFLRTLEYFQGIMFLTSNRVGVFDQAFQSRIHVTLGIPEFDEDTRKAVWKIFITDLGRKRQDGSDPLLSIDECKALGREVLNSWAREPLNGRQIRNCVRSALALAADKKEKVSAKHFNTVIRLGNTFTTYMNRLHKLRSDEIAQVKGDRLAEMRGLLEKSGTNANDPDDKTT